MTSTLVVFGEKASVRAMSHLYISVSGYNSKSFRSMRTFEVFPVRRSCHPSVAIPSAKMCSEVLRNRIQQLTGPCRYAHRCGIVSKSFMFCVSCFVDIIFESSVLLRLALSRLCLQMSDFAKCSAESQTFGLSALSGD